VSFLNLTLVEMRRALHRRIVRWMVVIALAGCAVAGIAAFVSSADPVEFARATEHPARMSDWWVPGTGDGFLVLAAMFLAIGAAVCGASVAGAEWRAGTITTVLTWEPSRIRLHLARTASSAVLAFVIGFALQAAFLASTLPAVLAHGTADGTDAAWWRSLVLAMARISLVTALVAVLAVTVATIGRNTSAALVALAAWALVVERVVVGLRPQLARFMITENVATVVPWVQMEGVEFERPPIVALVALLGYLGLLLGVATATFSRRDIVAST
jgi:hypothetical protein